MDNRIVNRIAFILLSIVGIVGMQFLIGFPLPFLYHNYLMYRFEKSVREIQFSSDTKLIGIASYFGIMYGNGNKCDAIVGAMLESEKNTFEMSSYLEHLDTELQAPWSSTVHEGFSLFQIIEHQYYAISGQGKKLVNFGEYEERFGKSYWQGEEIKYFDQKIKSRNVSPNENYYLLIVRDLGKQNSYNLMDVRCN